MSILSRSRWGISTLLVLLVGAVLRCALLSHYPYGFHYDEAANFIISRDIAFNHARPFPMFEAFNGREVFYYYINALAMRGIGTHIFTVRFVSAAMNLITMAATMALGRAMFGGKRGQILGLLAGGFLAVSFPQVFIARQGFRAVSLPMLQALSLWAIFYGLGNRRSRLWLISGGILGGAALYTYQASRLFPVWLAFVLFMIWATDRTQRGKRLGQAVIVMAILILVALPMGIYALDKPDIFADRLNQLSSDDDELPTYTESVRLHLEMFFIKGDPYIRYNEPLAPYFDRVSGVLLVIGWLVSVWHTLRWRQSKKPVAGGAYALMACAPLMVLPSVLAVGGMPPSHMRSIGMVPAIFFLPALGLLTLGEFLSTQLAGRAARFTPIKVNLAFLAAWIALFVWAGWTWTRYIDWASNPVQFDMSDGDMVTAGEWLAHHQDNAPLMYVTSLHYDHPSLQVAGLPVDRLTYLTGSRIFLPPPDRSAYLLETRNFPLPDDLKRMLLEVPQRNGPLAPDGQPAFTIYKWEGHGEVAAPAVAETVGGWLHFDQAILPDTPAGATVDILSTWHILASPGYDDLSPIFQLETPWGDVLARDEPFTQGALRWKTGETLIQRAIFDIPEGTPPGSYPVRVAWVGRTSDQYIGRMDADGNFAGIWSDIGTLTIQLPDVFPSASAINVPGGEPTDLGAQLRLLGWSELPGILRPGESPHIDLYWQSLVNAPEAGTLCLRAVSATENPLDLWCGDPVMGTYPFNTWHAGEIVVDRHRWRLPVDMPSDTYILMVEVGEQPIVLGQLAVQALDRQLAPPAVEHALDLAFGNTIKLAGYDLAVEDANVHLTLYWQALEPTDLPLTVFVHLVKPDGFNIDQHDAQPRDNTYPVTLWLPGEYVSDPHTLTFPADAPAGTYTLRVGLYIQTTGSRLSIVDSDGMMVGNAWAIAEITYP